MAHQSHATELPDQDKRATDAASDEHSQSRRRFLEIGAGAVVGLVAGCSSESKPGTGETGGAPGAGTQVGLVQGQ